MNYSGKLAGKIIKRFDPDDEPENAVGLAGFCQEVAAILSDGDSPLATEDGEVVVAISRKRAALTSKVLVDGNMQEVSRHGTMFRAQLWLTLEAPA